MNALDRAIKHFGNQKLMAKALKTVPPSISLWKRKGVPPMRAVEIEIATAGAIKRVELRPEVFGDLSNNYIGREQRLVYKLQDLNSEASHVEEQLKQLRAYNRQRFDEQQLELAV